MSGDAWVLVGGAGWIGSSLAELLSRRGATVTIVDRNPPPRPIAGNVRWQPTDLLVDPLALPRGRVVVLAGTGSLGPSAPWIEPLENAVTAARLAFALTGRDVVLLSSVEVYGWAGGPLREQTASALPMADTDIAAWCLRIPADAEGCPPWRAARCCRELAEADPSGRWVYAMSKLAQEKVVAASRPAALTILRLGNVFGIGQHDVVARLTRLALDGRPLTTAIDTIRSFVALEEVCDAVMAPIAPGVYNIGGTPMELTVLARTLRQLTLSTSPIFESPRPPIDSAGQVNSAAYLGAGGQFEPLIERFRDFVQGTKSGGGAVFAPRLPIVIPPRPARPDVVADRHAGALWSGRLKAGQRWSGELSEALESTLGLDRDRTRKVVLTTSGTAALRLAILSVAGPAAAGDMAVLPSFTFPATAEALAQLGYSLWFVDVLPSTWTMDPAQVDRALADPRVRLVVSVDTFGNPVDYPALRAICDRRRVPLVADSAAALGSSIDGLPVGTQAHAHAFSLSFAKTVTAGGMGGVAVVPAGTRFGPPRQWDRSEQMSELHAIAGLDQVEVLDSLLGRREHVAEAYRQEVAEISGVEDQVVPPSCRSAWAHFVVRVTGAPRSAVTRDLAEAGVETKPHFPALHRAGFRTAGPGVLPVTERLDQEALALPMSSEITPRHAQLVMSAVEQSLRRHRSGVLPSDRAARGQPPRSGAVDLTVTAVAGH